MRINAEEWLTEIEIVNKTYFINIQHRIVTNKKKDYVKSIIKKTTIYDKSLKIEIKLSSNSQ